MSVMIARPSTPSQRVFPPIGPDLYGVNDDEPTDLTPDQRAARNLLRLASRDFTRWERLLGWKLDAPAKVGRLLLLHQMVITAELEGQWRRADFFWHQAHTILRELSKEPTVWEALVETVASETEYAVMNDPEQLRLRLVNEMFIDTHCAFYNGRVRNIEELRPDDRAFAHTRYIADLIDLSGLSRDERLTMLDQPTRMQIELYQADEGWEQAVQICTEMLRLFPGLRDYQSKLAELHASNTMSRLDNGTAKQKSLADAATLSKGIHILEKTHEQYVYNVTFFEVLGHLHHLRAIKLANGGQLSEALVEVQKALVFNPYIEEAEKTRTKLIDMMTELRVQVQVLEDEWAKRPNAILSEEGQRLRTEALHGFEPLATYTKSAEAEETSTGFRIAQAHQVWHDVGLTKPEVRWDELALSLLEGLSHVLNGPPTDKSGVTSAWGKVAAQDTDLAELDSTLIYSFLERRLFAEESDQEVTQTIESPSDAPVLTGASAKRWQRDEPFEYWLFSLRGLRVKIQAVAAIALLLLASWLAIREFSSRKARDIAYHQIQAAASSKDYLSVIKGAETFFSNPILSGRDEREEQVGTLYSEAIVRWFVSRGDELDASAQAHIDRYRKLIVDSE